jgi:hypothetical protein
MKIELEKIAVSDLVAGYIDNNEEGVVGYSGRLNIRPPYQREFVYKPEQRNAVIKTVRNGFPLNSIYWVKNGDQYEMLDGQQRTISICQYVHGDFSIDDIGFHNLASNEKQQILDYVLHVYFCEGTDSEKIEWFKVINTAGEKLSPQELRNAIYTCTWLADAKLKFSKTNCAAYLLSKDYVDAKVERQELLETAIDWINDGKVEEYMSKHHHDQNANELWLYFQSVIQWVKATFTTYRREMKGLDWGGLYNRFKSGSFDTAALEMRIKTLMMDKDITKKKGIYEYILTGEERCLNLRTFDDSDKREAFERQGGICAKCGKTFKIEEMEGDHITPWHEGGKTITENCQMLCKDCNRRKAGK